MSSRGGASARLFPALAFALAPLWVGSLGGCENRPARPAKSDAPATSGTTTTGARSVPSAAPKEATTGVASGGSGAAPLWDAGAAPAESPAAITEETALHVLFGSSVPVEASRCEGDRRAKISCWLGARFAADEAAKKLALDIYAKHGTVVGQGEAETMDGAYRGKIRLVPTLPVGNDRRHLVWLHAALEGIDAFVRALEGRANAGATASANSGGRLVRYRSGPLVVKFIRSLDGRTTPSGFALDWQYSYNVVGSLNVSAESVMALAFHEIFHLNDTSVGERGSGYRARGARSWSSQALATDVNAILAKCHVTDAATAARSTACLTPYTPTPLQVRGGTYYAFQPGNDIVLEYAAELATRVFDEERAALGLAPKRPGAPFKCGPKENARSWKTMVDAFFAGVDLVPVCR